MNELISIIIPCYNEEAVIPLFYEEIKRQSDFMQNKFLIYMNYQIIFRFK